MTQILEIPALNSHPSTLNFLSGLTGFSGSDDAGSNQWLVRVAVLLHFMEYPYMFKNAAWEK